MTTSTADRTGRTGVVAPDHVVRYRRAARWFHTATYLVTFVLLVTGAEFFWFIWMTPALLAGYLAFLKQGVIR